MLKFGHPANFSSGPHHHQHLLQRRTPLLPTPPNGQLPASLSPWCPAGQRWTSPDVGRQPIHTPLRGGVDERSLPFHNTFHSPRDRTETAVIQQLFDQWQSGRPRCRIRLQAVQHIIHRHGSFESASNHTKVGRLPSWFISIEVLQAVVPKTLYHPSLKQTPYSCKSGSKVMGRGQLFFKQFSHTVGYTTTTVGGNQLACDCVCVLYDVYEGVITAYPVSRGEMKSAEDKIKYSASRLASKKLSVGSSSGSDSGDQSDKEN